LCADNIFAGNDAARVVPTPDDVIIGPVRFSTLRQAAQPNQYSSPTPDGLEYGIKIPVTVFGTNSTWIAIRVSDDKDQVKVSYSPGFSGQSDPKGESNLMALQSAILSAATRKGPLTGSSATVMGPSFRQLWDHP
jgi:peptidoglycan hydrolase-like protein with peptidoglycan-binding domain